MDTDIQLRMQAKQLEHEARRCQKESGKDRNKAKAELKKGNRGMAQMYAQTSVRADGQANTLLQQSAAVTAQRMDLQMARTTAETAKTMDLATKAMGDATKRVDLEKLSANRTKMDGLRSQLGAANDLLTMGESQLDVQAGVDALLGNLEAEINEEAMLQITSIPGAHEDTIGTMMPSPPV